ncbi:hypothetical protein SAMN04487909_13633 [Aneurinibacillus migulanus]|jgi:hypothetical protein|uniref:SpoVT-AbrB domain-containing protein n=2 Tax=Aneurinibacillus migulanus TaxID=47500 RepID=A0A1G8YKI5_ANEMI|nr:hypothetical protein [Aneurinibacillus migulanus]GED18082.1 hypothetical protein AMI01nite_60730 [Aneurinibacillus migulanus]SDK03271.1 hypothetical protein SAMN04487909_13633 [Aneurinibacillus migulanus]
MTEIRKYIIQIDENGRIRLPKEIVKNIHSGLLDFEISEDKLLVKEPEPNYIFIWDKE